MENRKLGEENYQLEKAILRLKDQKKQLSDELHQANRIVRAVRAGSEQFVLLGTLIGFGDSPVDLLSEAQRILYDMGKVSKRQTVEDAENMLVALLRSVSDRISLHPIAPYHQIVRFDPEIHQGDRPISEGITVQVLETGWRVDGMIIKKAYVTKQIEG